MTIPVATGRWPFLGHAPSMLSRRVRFTSSLRHHGDIVKIYLGPLQAYFLTSPQLVHQVLVTNGASFEKGIIFDRFRPFMGNGLVMSPEPFHLRQRRLMQPAFHAGQLARYAETMRQATTDLVTTWQPGGVRQFDADMQRLAVGIVGQTLFATQVGKPAIDEAHRSIPIVLKDGMIRALLPSIFDRLPIIPATRRFDHAVHRLRQTVLEVIASRRADPQDHGDLLSMLLNARDADTGERMTDQEIFDEVITLFTAGSETIAVALAWFFHELARNPEIEQRVRAEIAETLDGRPITFDDVPKLTYTRQVIDEVLRMYPIWILMRRARQDVELGGIHLTAGTEVMFSPYSLHLDSRFHADPDRFDPDRWETHDTAPPKGAFIPFGLGTRQCIGNKFAYTEITIAAATILAGWRLLPVPRQRVGIKVTSAAYPTRMPMTAVPLT